MSKFDDVYGAKWFKSADLNGDSKFQIEKAEWQKVGPEKEDKIVVAFVGEKKPLILNKTNANELATAWTVRESTWAGKWVELTTVQTSFGPGIRLAPSEADVPF